METQKKIVIVIGAVVISIALALVIGYLITQKIYVLSDYESNAITECQDYIVEHPGKSFWEQHILYRSHTGKIYTFSTQYIQIIGEVYQPGETGKIVISKDINVPEMGIFGCGHYVIPQSSGQSKIMHRGGWFRADVEVHPYLT